MRWLAAMSVALLLIAVPSIVSAQELPPHKDPRGETSAFSGISLLGYLGTIMELLAEADYDDVEGLLDQLRQANLPEDLRFIVDRYAELLGALRDDLDSTEAQLRLAAESLGQQDRPGVRRHLEAAEASLTKAQRSLDDLELATDSLARRVGVFAAVAGSPLRDVYDRLRTLLARLDDLWGRYAAMLTELDAGVVPSELDPPPSAEEPSQSVTPTPPAPAIEPAAPVITASVASGGSSGASGEGIIFRSSSGRKLILRFDELTTTVIVSVASFFVVLTMGAAWLRHRRSRRAPTPEVAMAARGQAGPLASHRATIEDHTPQGRVVAAYHRAARLVESQASIVFRPYLTLRGFLATVRSWVGDAFSELTGLAELALYGSQAVDDEQAAQAQALSERVARGG